jgi:hypothetical protein
MRVAMTCSIFSRHAHRRRMLQTQRPKEPMRSGTSYSRFGPGSVPRLSGPPRSDPVRLTIPLVCDRDELLAAWDRRDYRAVVACYTGEFLPRLESVATSDFAMWVERERANLSRRFAKAARHTINQDIAAAPDPDALRRALDLARRLRAHEPLAQDAWQLVLRSLILCGDHEGAALEADQLEALLAEHDLSTDPATRSILNVARAAPARAQSQVVPDPPFRATGNIVGRSREIAAILAAWDQARAGSFVHMHVTARAGLGKSALLADVRQRLRARPVARGGTRVVEVRASQASRDIGFSFAGDVVRALAERPGGLAVSEWTASVLVGLHPALSIHYRNTFAAPSIPSPERQRHVAIQELIAAVALEGPVCLFLDDLHWSDTESVEALAATLVGCAALPLLVVSAGRDAGDALCAVTGAQQLVLGQLDTSAIAELLTRKAALPRERWADNLPEALRESTGGSPLLVVETVQLLVEQSLLTVTSAEWSTRDVDGLFAILHDGSAAARRLAALAPLEQRLLLLLAVCEAPVSASRLRAAAAQTPAQFNASLTSLERRGLATRQGDVWTIAHDTHARAALDGTNVGVVTEAAVAMGRAIVDDAGDDVRDLRRAGPLLTRGGDLSVIAPVFERFVRLARGRGDRRPAPELAREFVGGADTEMAQRCVSALSWRVRVGLFPRRKAAALLAVVAVVVLVALFGRLLGARPSPPRNDAVLLATRLSADRRTLEYFPIALDAGHWAGSNVIDVRLNGRPRWRIPNEQWVAYNTPRPDGRGWTRGVIIPESDTGVIDIFDIALDGTMRRLTFARGDDFAPSWAPDMSRFAFTTSQWSNKGHYDIAVYDTLTRNVQQLTGGDEIDSGALWSPDGSRIGFARKYGDAGAISWCVIDANGQHLRCERPDSSVVKGFLGWSDADHILVTRSAHGVQTLLRLDLDTSASDTLEAVRDDVGLVPSPDGQFIYCECPRRGYPPKTRIVYPVERPNDFAVLRILEDSSEVNFEWAPTTRRLPFVSSMRILSGIGAALVGTFYQLRVMGTDTAGRNVPLGVVRWRSEDTTVATVDSTGRLSPRHAGQVAIIASAGGWREVRETVTVANPITRVLLDEDWTHGLKPAWSAYGVPKPELVAISVVGPAFLTNGDGVFASGVYSERGFDTRNGLWMEAQLSAPLTTGESQTWKLSMFRMGDSTAWANWDHETGWGPANSSASPAWGIVYPAGVGGPHVGEELDAFASRDSPVQVPPRLKTGQPFRLIMQVFPDGSLGIAIDGQPAWLTTAAYFEPVVHIRLDGNSVGTHMLIGPLRVMSGIAPVAWEQLTK